MTPKLSTRRMRLRTYFASLILLYALAALAGVVYVRVQSEQNARHQALVETAFAAKSASKVIAEGAGILQGAIGGLAASNIKTVLAHPSQCTLGYGQVGAFRSGHIDILRPTGSVVCSSRAGSGRASYSGQGWLAAARSAPGRRRWCSRPRMTRPPDRPSRSSRRPCAARSWSRW